MVTRYISLSTNQFSISSLASKTAGGLSWSNFKGVRVINLSDLYVLFNCICARNDQQVARGTGEDFIRESRIQLQEIRISSTGEILRLSLSLFYAKRTSKETSQI